MLEFLFHKVAGLSPTTLLKETSKAVKMCINSTKVRFMLDRSGKCFMFADDLYIKKGHSVSLFIFNCK